MKSLSFEILDKNEAGKEFDCGVDSINQYVSESYYATLTQQAHAYRVVFKGKCLGYFMIMFRKVEKEDCTEEVSDYISDTISDYFFSLHIKYIAIDKKYQRNGIGRTVLQTILLEAKQLPDKLPIRMVTIDALTHLTKWYEKEGFKKMGRNILCQEGISEYMYIDIGNIQNIEKYIEKFM